MRIGEPARKHGVDEADIWHAVRSATRRIEMDDDLTMLIGPARDGDDAVVIHAMRLRPKFYQFISQG